MSSSEVISLIVQSGYLQLAVTLSHVQCAADHRDDDTVWLTAQRYLTPAVVTVTVSRLCIHVLFGRSSV